MILSSVFYYIYPKIDSANRFCNKNLVLCFFSPGIPIGDLPPKDLEIEIDKKLYESLKHVYQTNQAYLLYLLGPLSQLKGLKL